METGRTRPLEERAPRVGYSGLGQPRPQCVNPVGQVTGNVLPLRHEAGATRAEGGRDKVAGSEQAEVVQISSFDHKYEPSDNRCESWHTSRRHKALIAPLA